jgi:hypothetical protein
MSDEKKADVTLKDGRKVEFDLDKLTLEKWRRFVDPQGDKEEEDAILADVAGLTVSDVLALPMLEWRRMTSALLKKVSAPLDDPN